MSARSYAHFILRWAAALALLMPLGLRGAAPRWPPSLDTMTADADLVFKGQALSSLPITNAAFRVPQMKVHATTFKIISVLKGEAPANVIVLQHYTTRPGGWSGARWPANYQFQSGESYLVFAARLDKSEGFYKAPEGATNHPGEFRQLANSPLRDDQGFTRTLNARPLAGLSVKEAHWFELNLLLTNSVTANALYAIEVLGAMTTNCPYQWAGSRDFTHAVVLQALQPLLNHANDDVAVAAIKRFRGGPACANDLALYAEELGRIVSSATAVPRRVAALAAFTGTKLVVVSNALPRWLGAAAEEVRAAAVSLLPNFPGEFSEQALRERATDGSANVRAAVADAIGNGQTATLLPTLVRLLADTTNLGGTPLAPKDVHAHAARALLQFGVEQVGSILKTNLADAEFRDEYLCKLAEKAAGPWLMDLAEVMESRRTRIQQDVEASGVEPRIHYFNARMALAGTYFKCWNIIHGCLQQLPKEDFAGGKLDRYLEVLEQAGTTGSREPEMIYELCRFKGLEERAARYRRHCEKTFSYDLSFAFERADSHFTNPPLKLER